MGDDSICRITKSSRDEEWDDADGPPGTGFIARYRTWHRDIAADDERGEKIAREGSRGQGRSAGRVSSELAELGLLVLR
jgi:hypothetical protein